MGNGIPIIRKYPKRSKLSTSVLVSKRTFLSASNLPTLDAVKGLITQLISSNNDWLSSITHINASKIIFLKLCINPSSASVRVPVLPWGQAVISEKKKKKSLDCQHQKQAKSPSSAIVIFFYIGLCLSGQRPSARTSKVSRHLRRETRKKIE